MSAASCSLFSAQHNSRESGLIMESGSRSSCATESKLLSLSEPQPAKPELGLFDYRGVERKG